MIIEEKDGNLVITGFNEVDAFTIAVAIEKDGIDFYSKILGKIENPEAKEVIDFLLNEEKKHLKFFQDCLYSEAEERDDRFEQEDILSTIDFGIFRPYKDIQELENILKDVKTALKLGLIAEEKSVRFYSLCRDKVESKDTKKILSLIIDEELKHKEIINSLLRKI